MYQVLCRNSTESHEIWGEYFDKLKIRGVIDVDLIVADGLSGLANTAKKHFIGVDFQRCVVHKQRNILNKVRPKEKAVVAKDLCEVFNNFDQSASITLGMEKLELFCKKWGEHYGHIEYMLRNIDEMEDYFTYISYPVEVRRMIYTTNSIENLNRQIKKVTKGKVTFDRTDNLLDLIFMVIKDFEANSWQKFAVHAYQNWPKRNYKKTQFI